MELRQEYKQTEVGVIPEDWEVRPCSELSERITVGIVIRPTQYYVRHGIPALRSANIREDGITDTDLVFISEASNVLLAKSQTRMGDVLTVRTGYPGTSAVVRPHHAGCNCIDILITTPSADLDSEYLAVWVNSSFGKEQVLRNQGGLAQKHFNVGDMRNLLVARPPIAEQRAIATALSDVDVLLVGLDRLIAKKRDLKQAAMQQLLTGQTRLPGFSGAWEVKRLGDVVDTDPEVLSGDTRRELTFKYIALENVDRGVLRGYSDQQFATAPSRARRKLRLDDVLVSTVRPNLQSHLLFRGEGSDWVCSTGFCVVRCRANVTHPAYVFFHLFAHPVSRQIEALLTGSNYPAINSGDVRTLEIPLPDFVEQTAIAAVLSDLDAELTALEASRDKTRNIKQAMMQQLLTGKTRLV